MIEINIISNFVIAVFSSVFDIFLIRNYPIFKPLLLRVFNNRNISALVSSFDLETLVAIIVIFAITLILIIFSFFKILISTLIIDIIFIVVVQNCRFEFIIAFIKLIDLEFIIIFRFVSDIVIFESNIFILIELLIIIFLDVFFPSYAFV